MLFFKLERVKDDEIKGDAEKPRIQEILDLKVIVILNNSNRKIIKTISNGISCSERE